MYLIACPSFHTPDGFSGVNHAEWCERTAQADSFRDGHSGTYDLFLDIAAHGAVKTYNVDRACFVMRKLTEEGFPAVITWLSK